MIQRVIFIGIFLFFSLINSFSVFAVSSIDNEDITNQAISYLKSKKFMDAYSDGQFHGDVKIRRADLIRILTNFYKIDPDSGKYKNCYEDVKDDWFSPYICYAKERKWLEGFELNYFHPLRDVTKGEALQILFPALNINIEGDPYNLWSYIETAKKLKIFDEFDEKEILTRGDLADFIFRMIILKDFKQSIFDVSLVYNFLNSESVKNDKGAVYYCSDIFKRKKDESYEECLYRKIYELEDGKYFDVIKISDGDTFYINYFGNLERVRLLGVDTPELINKQGGIDCYANEAKDKLDELIGWGKVKLVMDETNDNRDPYDRLLRYVYSEKDVFVNEFLVFNGYAKFFDKYPTIFDDLFRSGQEEARDLKLGLWSCK